MELPRTQMFLVLVYLTSACAGDLNVQPTNPASLVSEKESCYCFGPYDPVCANDNKTYGNPCDLKCARKSNPSLLGLCKGECPCCKEAYVNDPIEPETPSEPSPPPPGWKTPSASAIKHSESESQAEPMNLDVPLESGDTDKAGFYGHCLCPMIYAPVCGTDNVTYGNGCALGCEKRKNPCLAIACRGQCPCCPCKSNNYPF